MPLDSLGKHCYKLYGNKLWHDCKHSEQHNCRCRITYQCSGQAEPLQQPVGDHSCWSMRSVCRQHRNIGKHAKLIALHAISIEHGSWEDEVYATTLSTCTSAERNRAMCSGQAGCDAKQCIVQHCREQFCRRQLRWTYCGHAQMDCRLTLASFLVSNCRLVPMTTSHVMSVVCSYHRVALVLHGKGEHKHDEMWLLICP